MKKHLLILFSIVTLISVNAQNEYQAKAFFIYNFTRLIEWPSNSGTEFIIGVIGSSPIISELETITAGKRAGNQTIIIKQFKSPEEISNCNILYVSFSASSKIAMIQSSIKDKNTLIVGEKDGLTDQGAAINFILNNNRLSFQINVDNAQKQGLKVSKSLVDMSS